MTGAIFAAGFLVTQEFQLARGYSPVSAGVRLLPFFATPMLTSPTRPGRLWSAESGCRCGQRWWSAFRAC